MTPVELKTKRVLVVGAGITGRSVMRYLKLHDISFDVVDSKSELSESVVALLAHGQYISGLDNFSDDAYDVLVLSPGIPRAHSAIQAALAAGAAVIGDVELFASVVDGNVIAITGSNGKSTVASMAAHVLMNCGRSVELCGNIGTAVLDVLPSPVQAEEGIEHTAKSNGSNTVYVLELSSYQLESLNCLTPLCATVLNVSDDHLDRYDSMDHYAATKRQVYRQAKCCVVNADDERTRSSGISSQIVEFSTSNQDVQFCLKPHDDSHALYRENEFIVALDELLVPGLHNAANALAVIALLQPLNLSASELRAGLVSFKGLEHRTELVANKNGVKWFNDSKGTNVDACIKAIHAMPGPIVLIAGGQGKGVDFSPLKSEVAGRVKAIVLMGEDAPVIRAALEGVADVVEVGSMEEAVQVAGEKAAAGDVVLLSPACASFDMFENYMARGHVFRESVEQLVA